MITSFASSITKAASKQTYYTIRYLVDRERVDDAYRAYGYFRWVDANFDEVSRQRIVSHTILKTAGGPDDIARAVRFFAIDAPYVTGQVLAVDGGRNAKL